MSNMILQLYFIYLIRSYWRSRCKDSNRCFLRSSSYSTVCACQNWPGCSHSNRRRRCKLNYEIRVFGIFKCSTINPLPNLLHW